MCLLVEKGEIELLDDKSGEIYTLNGSMFVQKVHVIERYVLSLYMFDLNSFIVITAIGKIAFQTLA